MERGYFILEMIMLVAVVSIGVGIAITLYQQDLTSELIAETEWEMEELRTACGEYYEDTGDFPEALANLETQPEGIEGWLGPYLTKAFQDLDAADLDALHDAWGSDYVLTLPTKWLAEIRSPGPNLEPWDGDDLVALVDVNTIAWKTTRWELRVLRPAIIAYNTFSAPPELPSLWKNAARDLQQEGYLPPGHATLDRFEKDGWGQYYLTVGDPVDTVETAGPPPDEGGD